MSELSGLPAVPGLAGPGEPVPNELRILASQENLGGLKSVHRPATRIAKLTLKQARVFLYERGLVLADGHGSFGLFRWDQVSVTARGVGFQVTRQDGVGFRLTRHWSDFETLGRRLGQLAAGG
jgi:hypothetical protein